MERRKYDVPGTEAFYISCLTASPFPRYFQWRRRTRQARARLLATCHSGRASAFLFLCSGRKTPSAIRTRLVTLMCCSPESTWTTLRLHANACITGSASEVNVPLVHTHRSSCSNKVLSAARFRSFCGFSTAGGLSFDFAEYKGISTVVSANCLTIWSCKDASRAAFAGDRGGRRVCEPQRVLYYHWSNDLIVISAVFALP